MKLLVRSVCALAVIAALGAAQVHAGTPLTEDQAKKLDEYMRVTTRPQPQNENPVARVPAAPAMAGGSDRIAVAGHDITPTLESYLALSGPPQAQTSLTTGLAVSQGLQIALPDMEKWDKGAAAAVLAAFQNPDQKTTAEEAATFAATPASADPAFDARVELVRELFRVDGTDALLRSLVAKEHMKLIIQEVARHIDFNKLTENDKIRLASIVTVVQTELQDQIITLNARIQAANLSQAEITQLIAAFNIDPQRKLTKMRLEDDGKIDRGAELDLRLAMYQIVKQYEAGQ